MTEYFTAVFPALPCFADNSAQLARFSAAPWDVEFALLHFTIDDVAVAVVTLAANLHTIHSHCHAPWLKPALFADLSAIFAAIFPNALVALHWACVLPT